MTWVTIRYWLVLIALSAILAASFEKLNLPAGLLLGTTVAAILLAAQNITLSISRPPLLLTQAVIGVAISSKLPDSILLETAKNWPVFLFGTTATILASYFLSWILMRRRVFPGTTAIWGTSPGAAASMTVVSEEFGADMKIVALMQYFRVVMCIASVTVASKLGEITDVPASSLVNPGYFAGSSVIPLTIASIGCFVGICTRIPGGCLLASLVISMMVRRVYSIDVLVPAYILDIAYAVTGWGIGVRFSREALSEAIRLLPSILASAFVLIGLCAGIGAGLALFAGIDPLTAYLATSPGGTATVALITVSTNADATFVMTMQTCRFMAVLLIAPAMGRLLSRYAEAQ